MEILDESNAADAAKDRGGVRKLRFGIMCPDDHLPAAFAASVQELLRIEGVELALLIVDARPPVHRSFRQKVQDAVLQRRIIWTICERLLPQASLSSFRPVDMSSTYAGVPRVPCTVVQKGKFSQYFQPEDVDRIRSHKLDFILRFAFGIIRGDILNSARFGVWSFHHGDEAKYRGAPPAFWEVFKKDRMTGAILQRLTDRLDGGVVLQKYFIGTRSSHADNLNSILWATVPMPARTCRDILNGRASYLDAAPTSTSAPIYYTPTDFQMSRFLVKTGFRLLRNQFASILFSPGWNVGVVNAPIHAFLQPGFRPQVQWLPRRNGHCFVADPFPLKIGPKLRVLAEELDFYSNRGVIVDAQIDENGTVSWRDAIDEGCHMSYPYVFEHKGKFYCTPEIYSKRGIFLYVFDAERDGWQLVAPLMQDYAGVDPTLIQYEGRWWMFCTNHDKDVESTLFLWHAPELLGPWQAHPANPLKVDIRSSLPAGTPFIFEGNLYRPAQDSSRAYGGGITINRVQRLTLHDFSEEPVAHVEPIAPYSGGIHTLAGSGSVTIVDGNRAIFSPTLIRAGSAGSWPPLRASSGT